MKSSTAILRFAFGRTTFHLRNYKNKEKQLYKTIKNKSTVYNYLDKLFYIYFFNP